MPKREQMVGKEYLVVPPGHDQRGRAFDNALFLGGVLVVTMILAGLGAVWTPFQAVNYLQPESDKILIRS